MEKLKKRDEKWHHVEELAKRNPNFTLSIDSMSFYTDFARSPINDMDPTIDLKNLEEDTKYHIDTDVILLYNLYFNVLNNLLVNIFFLYRTAKIEKKNLY